MRRFLPIACLLLATSASAQVPTFQPVARPLVAQAVPGGRPGALNTLRVQVQMQLYAPAKPDEAVEEQQKAQETMRRTFYEMAAHECGTITQALPGDCRMVSLNVSGNAMQRFNATSGGITGSASASFEITPKAAP